MGFLFARISKIVLMALLLSSWSVASAVVFGEDDRHEVYEMPPDLQAMARAVAVKVPQDFVAEGGGYYAGVPLSRNYCSSNRFSDQILLPAHACTAFLVKPDVLVTAGHCIKPNEDLCGPTGNFRYVFDYRKKSAGDNVYTQITGQNIYKCKAILGRRLEDFGDVDYAVIQLDRPVLDRQPLALELSRSVALGDSVFAIGYPTGLPEKITTHGSILEIKNSKAFGNDLDLFSGNSGSPILDVKTGKVVAINSHGESDWVRNGSCKIVKNCEVGKCTLSYASSILNLKDEAGIK